MTAYIVQHQRRAVTIERTIIESPEANELQNAICRAVGVYFDLRRRESREIETNGARGALRFQ
jgi:hypothetical protein